MRIRVFIVFVACMLSISRAAHAGTLNFALTPTSGNAGAGYGSATLTGPLSTTPGVYTVYSAPVPAPNLLDSLTFTIGGDTFTLSDNPFSFGFITFLGGVLNDVSYEGQSPGQGIEFLVTSNLTYSFIDTGTGEFGAGTISTVTPEPESIILFATGLLMCSFVQKRHSRLEYKS